MAEAVEEYWAERTEDEQVEGNIVYDEAAAQAVRETTIAVESIFSKAAEAIANAQTVLSNTPEAGGNLGTDSGRTILGNIRKAVQGLQDVLEGIGKMRKAWEQIIEILTNAGTGCTSVARNWTWSMIETVGSMSDEETDDLIIDTAELIGKVGQVFSDDPIVDEMMGNLGDSARAYVSGKSVQDSILDSYGSRLSSGEIGVGEYLSGGLTAGVTNAVVSVVDMGANLIGLDIPDSFNEAASNAMGWLGEKAYQVVSGAVKSGWRWSSLAA